MTRQPHRGTPLDVPVFDEDAELREALVAAFSPSVLSDERHEKIIEAALADPLAPASPEELRDAESLRLALEGIGIDPDAELANALKSAWDPPPFPGRLPSLPAPIIRLERPRSSKARSIRGVLGLCAASLAVAAATVLVLRRGTAPELPVASVSLYEARSTVALFHEEFKRGEASERVDRIAAARARELRSNRYALWGVP